MRTFAHNLFKAATAASRKLALCLALVILSVFSLRAGDSGVRVKILFPFDSDSVQVNYRNNAAQISALTQMLAGLDNQATVSVTSFSSPDGNLDYNRNLSLRRAKAIQAYLQEINPSVNVEIHPGEEAWDALRESVSADTRMSADVRDEVLEIIDSEDALDVKEAKLVALPQYKSLYANYFKQLRYAVVELKVDNSAKSVNSTENSKFSGNSQISEGSAKKTTKNVNVQGPGLPIVYYVVNEDFIRPSYMGNDANMKEIIRLLKSGTVKNMVIEGSASPEGPAKGNVRLAKERAENLKNYILGMFPEMEDMITVVSAVSETTDLGTYPFMRFARIVSMDVEEEEELPIVVEEIEDVKEVKDTILPQEPIVIPAKEKVRNTVAAVKTNLLYDAVTALNFEVEVPIGNRFSVMAENVFPWWETGNKYCFQLWEMGVEARYWFKPWNTIGTEKLRGFFVGPYVMSAKYDFQWDKKINYQGEFWSVGATAGYSTAIGRNKRVNLEFSISFGYMQSPYRHYLPTDDYSKLIHDPNLDGTFYNYFLYPTKAKISLVVPLNFTTKKEVSHD